jgi:ribosomal protein S18 acetylase RimI-like enzyme
MKETMDLVQANIENLTSLWRTAGGRTHISRDDFDFGDIDYSEWPNRLWFHQDINEDSLKKAKIQVLATSTQLVIPYWDIYQSHSYELLEANGFQQIFEQIGMSLKMTQPYEKLETLRIEKVSNKKNAILWEELFMQAFKYRISHKVLISSYEDIDYLIAYHENEPVGTAILYYSGDGLVGIHSMGIIPKKRRMGFAEQMMINLLHQATAKGSKYATLQASNMGKGLYFKLGFEEQFIIKNYALAK